jgi:hypothetical protein
LPSHGSSARQVFEAAQAHGLLEASITQPLMDAKEFLSDLMSLLRLSAPGGLITDEAPPGLKTLLVQGMHLPSFSALKEQVLFHEARVMRIVEAMQRGEL